MTAPEGDVAGYALTPALTLAHIIDSAAFEDHPIEQRREAAALQWAARRHIAHEHAARVLAAGYRSPAEVTALVAEAVGAERERIAEAIEQRLHHTPSTAEYAVARRDALRLAATIARTAGDEQ